MMTKRPDWPSVCDLMTAGKRQTPRGRACIGMTEIEAEGQINTAEGEGGLEWAPERVHWCLEQRECKHESNTLRR